MCEAHRLCYVFQGGISGLRYSRCRNGFRLLHQRECKRSESWTSAEIFQNNVCGSAVPCCFINENINAMEVGHQRKFFRITFLVVRCRIARLHLLRRLRRGSLPLAVFVLRTSPCQACSLVCANGLPRRNLGFAEMKTGGRSRTRICDLHDVNVTL